MKIEGTHTIAAPREKVYAAFINPDALAACTPGLEQMDKVDEDTYAAQLTMGVAAIKGKYSGKMKLTDQNPPESYRLHIEGSGAPGFVQGVASFTFNAEGDSTLVVYSWDVQVGGMVAGVGQRILGGVAKMVIGQFMQAMAKYINNNA